MEKTNKLTIYHDGYPHYYIKKSEAIKNHIQLLGLI